MRLVDYMGEILEDSPNTHSSQSVTTDRPVQSDRAYPKPKSLTVWFKNQSNGKNVPNFRGPYMRTYQTSVSLGISVHKWQKRRKGRRPYMKTYLPRKGVGTSTRVIGKILLSGETKTTWVSEPFRSTRNCKAVSYFWNFNSIFLRNAVSQNASLSAPREERLLADMNRRSTDYSICVITVRFLC